MFYTHFFNVQLSNWVFWRKI